MIEIDRKTKLRFRRNVRKSKRQVENISVQAEEKLEKLFIRRLHRLVDVRRFVGSWLALVGILVALGVFQIRHLGAFYLETTPANGGVFTEGVLGSFTNANPVYAIGGVDGGVSRLLFSSLFEYDKNGELVGNLAINWKVDETGKIYTVTLRDDVKWHDGEEFSADDVVFTYRTIQNPDAQSPLFSSWRDVRLKKTDDRTVQFTLPNVFAAFPHSMTNGIIPNHLLDDVAADQLRSDQFNTIRPVGTGPFEWEAVEVSGQTPEDRQEQIALKRYDNYHKGPARLNKFVINSFRNEDTMTKLFMDRGLSAMSGLNNVVDTIDDSSVQEFNLPLTGAVMVFFKTTEGVLKDKVVRQALVRSVNTTDIVNALEYSAIVVDGPLLRSQIGYNPKLVQLEHDVKEANRLLDEAGWKMGENGVRVKGDKELAFGLKAPNNSEFTDVTRELQKFWTAIGAKVTVDQPNDAELQSIVSLHQYDAVIYSIGLGKDPDVFAFWHSSQADVRSNNRLNLSEYQSDIADQSLEAGRTRIDPKLRKVKYEPFLKQWREDAPALAMYQPRYVYVTRGYFSGFDSRGLHSANDRYNSVHNWTIKTQESYKY